MCAQKTVGMSKTPGRLIALAALFSRALFEKAAHSEGITLTLSQLAILMALSEKPIDMKGCGVIASVDRSTTSNILWRLSRLGFVNIRFDNNGAMMRSNEVTITSKGAELRDKGAGILERLDTALLEEVGSPEEQTAFLDQLDRFTQHHEEGKELRAQTQ